MILLRILTLRNICMKYETFEELYNDNRELIDLEFKSRLYDVLDKILAQIDTFQKKEHDEIDGFQPYTMNQPHRDNIEKLEKIYKPFYNYIKTIALPYMEKHNTIIQELKHKFIDIVLPEDEIMKERGKPGWHEKMYRNRKKQMALAELLEGFLIYAYKLGASNKDTNCEIEDHYDTDTFKHHYLSKQEDGTDKLEEFDVTFAEERKHHVINMRSYGKMSWGNLVSSIYDMGCKKALDNGIEYPEAAEYGMKEAVDFVKNVFKDDREEL